MKAGAKNIEWFVIMGLIIATLVQFLMMSTGIRQAIPTTITNSILLLIFAGQLLVSLLLLRIYDKIR